MKRWLQKRSAKEEGAGDESDSSLLAEYLKTNWLMKRIDLSECLNDGEEGGEEVDGIGQHLVEERDGLEEEKGRSRMFKLISNVLIYENLAFNR